MFSLLLVLLIIVAVLMVLVILLQKSEGGGISGASASQMFGGALTGSGAKNFLSKLTAWLATIFFVICGALALTVSRGGMNLMHSDVRDELENIEQAAVQPAAAPIPGAPATPEK